MTARTLSFVLGMWQFFAAFAIPRARPSFAAAWILGLLAAVLSVVGLSAPRARWGAAAAGVGILVSALLLQHRTPVGWWNDVIVGAALAAISLVPGTMYAARRRATA